MVIIKYVYKGHKLITQDKEMRVPVWQQLERCNEI